MEVPPQRPNNPTKDLFPRRGGVLAYDSKLERLVMIESFQLGTEFNDPDPRAAREKNNKSNFETAISIIVQILSKPGKRFPGRGCQLILKS